MEGHHLCLKQNLASAGNVTDESGWDKQTFQNVVKVAPKKQWS